jgi:SEC-C motif-containing protein
MLLPSTTILLVSFIVLLTARCNEGFAAKKPSKNVAKTSKGFGSAPPTLEDFVKGFRTRLPTNAEELACPCGATHGISASNGAVAEKRLLYKDCCQPIHRNTRSCTSPLDVLRSRYSAFCYRLIPHIIATTHSSCRDYQDDQIAWAESLNRNGMFDSFDFVALEQGPEEIIDGSDTGYIKFTVRLRAKHRDGDSSILEGLESSVTERSTFLRDSAGVWSYASGEVTTAATGTTVLN